MQNESRNSLDGSSSETPPDSPPSCNDCPQSAMLRLAQAIEEQNQALWALIGQTAALIEMVVQGHEEDEDDPRHYLDGSRIS